MALVGLFQPREPIPTVTLGLLVAQYSDRDTGAFRLARGWGPASSSSLRCTPVHSLYAVSAGVPLPRRGRPCGRGRDSVVG